MLDHEPTGASDADRQTAPRAADTNTGSGTSRTRRRATRSAGPPAPVPPAETRSATAPTDGDTAAESAGNGPARRGGAAPVPVLFVAPEPGEAPAVPAEQPIPPAEQPATRTRRRIRSAAEATDERPTDTRVSDRPVAQQPLADPQRDEHLDREESDDRQDEHDDGEGRRRRRRGRRGRGRGKGAADEPDTGEQDDPADDPAVEQESAGNEPGEGRRRRRRRRRGSTGADEPAPDDPPNTVVKVREPRKAIDEVQGLSGSTRLEAKRQRRRDGREHRRTRPPILSESEFLARRESVARRMVVRQVNDRTQIAVLEDDVLVEHYVTAASSRTMVGSVFLGKVQNVLPSMEAAFIDIGRGRNAVLYAGEVNWDSAGLEGRTRAIERALKPGDAVLVQVTKDPIGHKGARLTSHVTLSGRHLVYVPGGHASGISRKLPDTERKRLRDVLKKLVPEEAGVIVRTAAEGASAEDLERDVLRLQERWETIQRKSTKASAPSALYEEPDLVIRVVRDLFNEDFTELVVSGDEAWPQVAEYVEQVSPDLMDRLRRHAGPGDAFAELRIDEQLMKALDRKVFLPSGGSLVIDRTEAMTVIDVNTGKFIGSGGNLEETVTRNNLEAAEEIVRQLRLRDIGGIVVIDFIDMVLESNRELVLRRLTECLGRDRTKHQVTEITSLGLVQMTRKRLGQPLIDAFSETCEHCRGRGVIVHLDAPSGGHAGKKDAAKKSEPTKKSEPAKKSDSSKKSEKSKKDDKAGDTRSTGATSKDAKSEDAKARSARSKGTRSEDAKAADATPKDGGAKDGEQRDDMARTEATTRDDAARDAAAGEPRKRRRRARPVADAAGRSAGAGPAAGSAPDVAAPSTAAAAATDPPASDAAVPVADGPTAGGPATGDSAADDPAPGGPVPAGAVSGGPASDGAATDGPAGGGPVTEGRTSDAPAAVDDAASTAGANADAATTADDGPDAGETTSADEPAAGARRRRAGTRRARVSADA